MNLPRAANTRRLVIAAAALILGSTALLFWSRDVIREAAVIPFSYLLWAFRILVDGSPQIIFWIMALLIGMLIAYYSLTTRRRVVGPRPLALNEPPPDAYISGRAVFWYKKANLLIGEPGGYSDRNFHTSVVRLLVEIFSYRCRLPARAIEDQIRDGSLNLQPEVLRYLQYHLSRVELVPVSFFERLRQSVTDWTRWLWRKITADPSGSTPVVDEQLAIVLKFMEEELEVLYDDTGR